MSLVGQIRMSMWAESTLRFDPMIGHHRLVSMTCAPGCIAGDDPASRHHRKEQEGGEDHQMHDPLKHCSPAGAQGDHAENQRHRQ